MITTVETKNEEQGKEDWDWAEQVAMYKGIRDLIEMVTSEQRFEGIDGVGKEPSRRMNR